MIFSPKLAGLDDVWHAGTAEELVTCTVLTTASSDTLRWLHDWMPVILHDDAAAAKWLDIENQSKISNFFKRIKTAAAVQDGDDDAT